MHTTVLPLALLLAGSSLAAPASLVQRDTSAADIIRAIMPTSNTCAGAQKPDECRIADQAAPFLITDMQKYGVYNAAEIGAILSLIGYESNDMKYKTNLQDTTRGTSNMQGASFNAGYATSLSLSTQGLDGTAILNLLKDDKYNFGSGAWFLTTQCASIRPQLQQGTDAGFAAYMGCVGVSASQGNRMDYWNRAKTAFGLKG